MSLIIQHEWYKKLSSEKWLSRDREQDAIAADHEEEKYYGYFLFIFNFKKQI
ncbi:MAG: hypothetical protein ACFFHV_17070 [Promethearchaeota archaeon]